MNYRSHTPETIRQALTKGEQVWYLDTGQDGEDDMLIGDLDGVCSDISDYLDPHDIPAHWALIQYFGDDEYGSTVHARPGLASLWPAPMRKGL